MYSTLSRFSQRHVFLSARTYINYSRNNQIIDAHKTNVSLSSSPKAIHIGTIDQASNNETVVEPSMLKENPEFISLLHKTISQKVINDFAFIVDAGANVSSYMPIYDFRNPPPYGRIPEVDDVFGYVHVNDKGKIVEGSYEVNHMYRLCNATGTIQLSDYLLEEIRKACDRD